MEERFPWRYFNCVTRRKSCNIFFICVQLDSDELIKKQTTKEPRSWHHLRHCSSSLIAAEMETKNLAWFFSWVNESIGSSRLHIIIGLKLSYFRLEFFPRLHPGMDTKWDIVAICLKVDVMPKNLYLSPTKLRDSVRGLQWQCNQHNVTHALSAQFLSKRSDKNITNTTRK